MLILTDKNSVIGAYCPDEWECTTGAKNSRGWSDRKDVVSGLPFLFYFLDDKIEIIKHTDLTIPSMRSDKDWLMVFGGGFWIHADQNERSQAYADDNYFVYP